MFGQAANATRHVAIGAIRGRSIRRGSALLHLMERAARTYVVLVESDDPVRLREVIEEHGWQMPLAPFVADGDTIAILEARARKRMRQEARPGVRDDTRTLGTGLASG